MTFLLGLVTGKFAERPTQADRVLEQYILKADRQREAQNEAAFRMGLLQRSGAAQLSRRRLKKLAARVVAHGLKDPPVGYGFFRRLAQRPVSIAAMGQQGGDRPFR